MVALGPLGPWCAHTDAVPVETFDGERVAWLCPDCDQQMHPHWPEPRPFAEYLAEATQRAERERVDRRARDFRLYTAIYAAIVIIAAIVMLIWDLVHVV